ncbi:MAG: DUF58 domain-containing protein [Planctomycetota bacterium]|nr:MAG: DUF58 domain-containing protein [Planctomycetota bacterium]
MAEVQSQIREELLQFDSEFLRRLEYLNVVARKIFAGLIRADRQSIKRGTSAEFADHRPYVPGDDFRHVDWHLFGRLEELFLKLYREEENLHMTILLDCSQSMDFGRTHKLSYALQVTAALAYIGMANMDSVNVLPFQERLQEGLWNLKGRGKIFPLFEFLKELNGGGETSFPTSFREFISRERRRGIVVVISDFYDRQGFQPGLKFLRFPRHDIYVIHVVDRLEMEPDLRGELRLVDSENQEHQEITITDGMLRRYKEAFGQLTEEVEAFCIRNEMGYVKALTEIPFDQLVLKILRRGGLVG